MTHDLIRNRVFQRTAPLFIQGKVLHMNSLFIFFQSVSQVNQRIRSPIIRRNHLNENNGFRAIKLSDNESIVICSSLKCSSFDSTVLCTCTSRLWHTSQEPCFSHKIPQGYRHDSVPQQFSGNSYFDENHFFFVNRDVELYTIP